MPVGPFLSRPSAANTYQGDFVARVADSYQHVTGRSLYDAAGIDPAVPGLSAWNGAFALLCHRGDAAATLNYGNALVLQLWDCNWDRLVTMPSAATAPPDDRAERDDLMQAVARNGFVSRYSGRRLSTSGRLFVIEDVTVWRLLDKSGESFGVAAFFKTYRYL